MLARVGGQLAVTRSIGDHALRDQGVIPSPYTRRLIIRPSDRYIIIATDGVWDSLTESNIWELVGHKSEAAETVTRKIVKCALDKGSRDNVTCLTLKL